MYQQYYSGQNPSQPAYNWGNQPRSNPMGRGGTGYRSPFEYNAPGGMGQWQPGNPKLKAPGPHGQSQWDTFNRPPRGPWDRYNRPRQVRRDKSRKPYNGGPGGNQQQGGWAPNSIYQLGEDYGYGWGMEPPSQWQPPYYEGPRPPNTKIDFGNYNQPPRYIFH